MKFEEMAPNQNNFSNIGSVSMEPVSRTYQYRKVMKPMLERKRRARINRCLDELKELMTGALQSEGENVAKLEKADILELTVRHLHNLREKNSLFFQSSNQSKIKYSNVSDRFWDGFRQCAGEVSQFLNKFDQNIPDINLLKHINGCIRNMELSYSFPSTSGLSTTSSINGKYYGHESLQTDNQLFMNPLRFQQTKIQMDNNDNNLIKCRPINLKPKLSQDESCVWRPW